MNKRIETLQFDRISCIGKIPLRQQNKECHQTLQSETSISRLYTYKTRGEKERMRHFLSVERKDILFRKANKIIRKNCQFNIQTICKLGGSA